jgi:hypothetical protein
VNEEEDIILHTFLLPSHAACCNRVGIAENIKFHRVLGVEPISNSTVLGTLGRKTVYYLPTLCL